MRPPGKVTPTPTSSIAFKVYMAILANEADGDEMPGMFESRLDGSHACEGHIVSSTRRLRPVYISIAKHEA